MKNYHEINDAILNIFKEMRYQCGRSHAAADTAYYFLSTNDFFAGRLFDALSSVANKYNLRWYLETVEDGKFAKISFYPD